MTNLVRRPDARQDPQTWLLFPDLMNAPGDVPSQVARSSISMYTISELERTTHIEYLGQNY